MSTYFNEEWFYERFMLPECEIRVDDREFSVEVDFTASKEDRELGRIPAEKVALTLSVEMPALDPCAYMVGAEEKEDPFDEAATAAALAALKRIIREHHGCGLATYWFWNADRDDPGFRPLTEKENEKVREFLTWLKSDEPLCKNAPDAIRTIENMCRLIVEEMDRYEEFDPLLLDHLACFTSLRREIRRNGLPTIADENMFYEIVLNNEAVFVQLCHVNVGYGIYKRLSLFDKDSDDNDCTIFAWRTVLYSVPFPLLSCAEFAERCGVNQGTVRQWIRRGKIRSAFKSGRDWMIPATTRPPGRGFTPGRYHLTKSIPVEAIVRYPFLKRISVSDQLVVDKAANSKFFVWKSQTGDRTVIATLSQEDREKFEYFLLEADWVKHDLGQKILRTVTYSNREPCESQDSKEATDRMNNMDMNMLRCMEDEKFLDEVARRTRLGEIKWVCVECNPLSLMDEDDVDEKPAYLSQTFELEGYIDGLLHSLEVTESIDIPSGMGDIHVVLGRSLPHDRLRIDFGISYNEEYEDHSPETLREAFQDEAPVVLADALLPQIALSECVTDAYEWSRFYYGGKIPAKLRRRPLVRLSEMLYNQRRTLDFHRCVLDTEYRKGLLADPK